ncbi:hypothetical protein GQ54DRAFT_23003 [Martensiomyces pterosporus]|nr:hypothetical protein GQ54DRAFT_23003 [Martensiomyces pterosporus]
MQNTPSQQQQQQQQQRQRQHRHQQYSNLSSQPGSAFASTLDSPTKEASITSPQLRNAQPHSQAMDISTNPHKQPRSQQQSMSEKSLSMSAPTTPFISRYFNNNSMKTSTDGIQQQQQQQQQQQRQMLPQSTSTIGTEQQHSDAPLLWVSSADTAGSSRRPSSHDSIQSFLPRNSRQLPAFERSQTMLATNLASGSLGSSFNGSSLRPSTQATFGSQQITLPLLPAALSRHPSFQSQSQPQPQPQSTQPRPLSFTASQSSASAAISSSCLQRPRFHHQRTLSVQGVMTPHTMASTSSSSYANPSQDTCNSPGDAAASSGRSRRRCSIAASTNLSITHGLPVDPDHLDMDEDDEFEDDGNFDGDIDDEDSLMLDDNAEGSVRCPSSRGWQTSECEGESIGQQARGVIDWDGDSARIRAMAEEFEKDKSKIASSSSQPVGILSSSSSVLARGDSQPQAPGSAPLGRRLSLNMPRNKAFVRLLSLVEEDMRPLASEMEHEGHITRSIRHSNVHEWLRSSHAHNSQQSALGVDEIPTPNGNAGSPLRRTARLMPARAARDNANDSSESRDTTVLPASPASSIVSSPGLFAGGVAAGSVATMNIKASAQGKSGVAPAGICITTAVRPGKRKSMDDGCSSSGGPVCGNRSPLDMSPSSSSSLRHPYKRQAMSPSGLRAQIAIGKSKLTASPTLTHLSSSSSPQQMARPIAFPIISQQPLPSPSAGACPSNNPLLQGMCGGMPSSVSRARSRSNAGAGSVNSAGGLSILQANGGFSRMNISDKMDDDP